MVERRVRSQTKQRVDDINLKAFGVELHATGRMVIIILLVCAVLGFGLWHAFTTMEEHSSIARSVTVLTYVLTLSEQERKDLRLQIPDELIHRTIEKNVKEAVQEDKR